MLKTMVALVLVLVPALAFADDDAEKLYEEGRALIEAGKPVDACAKFEQSLAKDPRQVGVLMNLGLCNERIGKIATALQLYREAFDRAGEANLAGVRAKASSEIARLTPDVPILAIAHTAAPLPGEKLLVDDAVVGSDRKELPLDPGRHAIVVTAPGHLPFETTLSIKVGAHDQLVVPVLEVPKQTAVVTAGPSARRPVGKIMAAGGAVLVVAAAGLGIYAKHDYNGQFGGSSPHCGAFPPVNGDPTCDDVGQARVDHDRKLADAGLIVGAAGIAIALTGAALWLTAPSESSLVPTVTPTSVGLAWLRAF